MKNLLFVLALFVTIQMNAGSAYVGFKLGGSFSTEHVVGASSAAKTAFNSDKKMYLGPSAGISIFARFNNYVGLQPEFNFVMKSLKYKNALGTEFRRFMQAELPIMIKGGYGKEHYFIYASFGGYFAANLLAQDIVKPSGSSTEKNKLNFDDNHLKRFDGGIAAGAGAMYISKVGALDLEFRYSAGLVNQLKSDLPLGGNLKWTSYCISLAYMFNTGGKN